jgi:hypothetical protein
MHFSRSYYVLHSVDRLSASSVSVSAAVLYRLASLLHAVGRHVDALGHFNQYSLLRPKSTWGYVLSALACNGASKVRASLLINVLSSTPAGSVPQT